MKKKDSGFKFNLILTIVCAVMAILVYLTADENVRGGLTAQRTIVLILTITSGAFFTRLVPSGEKRERRKKEE